jgi:hypothetical protein
MPKKPSLETLINKYVYKSKVVYIAKRHGLSAKGTMKDLIEALVSAIPLEELLSSCFGVEDLKDILEEQGLPKSGKKSELVERVLSLIETPEVKTEAETKDEKKPSAKKGAKSLADEIVKYLEDATIGSIGIHNEKTLEYYLFGRLEEFFRDKDVTVVPQAIGASGARPDLTIERGEESVLVELKYIRWQTDYIKGIGQAQNYSGTVDRKNVILFCYDPNNKIKQKIPHIPTIIPIIK